MDRKKPIGIAFIVLLVGLFVLGMAFFYSCHLDEPKFETLPEESSAGGVSARIASDHALTSSPLRIPTT